METELTFGDRHQNLSAAGDPDLALETKVQEGQEAHLLRRVGRTEVSTLSDLE